LQLQLQLQLVLRLMRLLLMLLLRFRSVDAWHTHGKCMAQAARRGPTVRQDEHVARACLGY